MYYPLFLRQTKLYEPPSPMSGRLVYEHRGFADKKIQATDFDALASKYSAMSKGYVQDKYLDIMVDVLKKTAPRAVPRDIMIPKFPIINRGTYVRILAVDELLGKLLVSHKESLQIVSLGAGSDSRPFNVLEQYPNVVYHEIDFEEAVDRKTKVIKANDQLGSIIKLTEKPTEKSADSSISGLSAIHTSQYHLHAIDLRKLSEKADPIPYMDPSRPTVVLSECCLCYMPLEQSNAVIEWFCKQITHPLLAFVLYEPIASNDSFGQVMTRNLSARGVSTDSLKNLPTIESQINRLKQLGIDYSFGASTIFIHNNWISADDATRINRLEILDELEELNLLLGHYCIIWGSRVPFEPFAQFPYENN